MTSERLLGNSGAHQSAKRDFAAALLKLVFGGIGSLSVRFFFFSLNMINISASSTPRAPVLDLPKQIHTRLI